MNIFKKIFLTACSLVLTPMFTSNAQEKENGIELEPGCYKVISNDEILKFCIKDGGTIVPIEDIEVIDSVPKNRPGCSTE